MNTYTTELTLAERQSQRAYRRARADARRAASFYKQAAARRTHAAWLTRRRDLWDASGFEQPAAIEEAAATWTRIADHFLQSSFRQTEWARFYSQLARRYSAMEARS